MRDAVIRNQPHRLLLSRKNGELERLVTWLEARDDRLGVASKCGRRKWRVVVSSIEPFVDDDVRTRRKAFPPQGAGAART